MATIAEDLPVEIWQEVIRMALLTPYPIDTRVLSPLHPEWKWRTSKRFWHDSKSAARQISRVCKSWRVIALRYMFEAISVPTDRITNLPVEVGSDLHKSSEEGGSALNYVRAMRIKGRGTPATDEAVVALLQRYCPHITFYAHCSFDNIFPISIFRACGSSLRRLELVDAKIPEDFPEFLTTLVPHLEILSLACLKYPENDPNAFFGTICLPSLHTLEIEDMEWPVRWETPQLCALRLVDIGDNLDMWLEHSPLSADTLRHLDLIGCEPMADPGLIIHLFNFPFLETLSISCENLGALSRYETSPPRMALPSLWYIHLRNTARRSARARLVTNAALETAINRSRFPGVTYIHISENNWVEGQYGDWGDWYQRLDALGITLEA